MNTNKTQSGQTFAPLTGSAEFRRLLDDFERAAMRAGASNSGYVIDIAAGVHWDNMKALKAKLLAFADQIPPNQQICEKEK